MLYCSKYDADIKKDLDILCSRIKFPLSLGVTPLSARSRIGDDITQNIAEALVAAHQEQSFCCPTIRDIEINNHSPKEPYELRLNLRLDVWADDLHINLLPVNQLKSACPYIGSINKYISRITEGHFFDMIFFIKYVAKPGEETKILSINPQFVKDIVNLSLYQNWQLQANMQTIKFASHTTPRAFANKLINLLHYLSDERVKQIAKDCETRCKKLKNARI